MSRSSRWLESEGEDVIDENRFQNCVRESEKAPLDRVSTKGILADMNVETELNNQVNKTHI